MSEQANLTRLQQFISELNAGDLATIQRYMARDFFAHVPAANEPTQSDIYHDLVSELRVAFPDLQIAVQDPYFEDDLIKGKLILNGTHTGPLWGAPASGIEVTWTADIFLRPIGDRFTLSIENVTMPELMGVLRQIDLAPPAGQMDRPFKYPVVFPEIVVRALFTGQVGDKPCSHLDDIRVTDTTADVCEQCVAQGDIWPALRMCLICGFVGCCDTSKNKHMKQHYEQTGHPIFRSIRLDESWVWCYEDSAFFSGTVLEKYR